MPARVTIAAVSIALANQLFAAPVVRSVSVIGTKLPVHLETRVGQTYDSETVARDVRSLWSTSRFSDIRVERTDDAEGSAVAFLVVEQPMLHLRRIVIEPDSYGLKFDSPEDRLVTLPDAQRLATRAREALSARGYTAVSVDAALLAFGGNQADVRLTVRASAKPARVRRVEFTGAPSPRPHGCGLCTWQTAISTRRLECAERRRIPATSRSNSRWTRAAGSRFGDGT